MTTETMIPLPDAAFVLGMTWDHVYRLVLSRKLLGEKRGARWYVDAAAVKKMAAQKK